MSDPYIDPEFGILRNKFGITDQESLDRVEANAVSTRSILLQLNPLKGNFDSEHRKAIHSYLFRDVYAWAGQFRTIPLAKAEDVRGGRIVRFTPPDLIERELKHVFDELANNHFLEALPRREFARKIAALFSEINRIHPFREGNGRAQRQFVRQLADSLGFKTSFRGCQQGASHPGQHPVGERGFCDDGTPAGRNHGHRAHSIAGKSDRAS
jgi:cell filamentation protein